MKALGRNLIIEKSEDQIKKTEGGLLLAEIHRDDIRYIKATIISIGDDVKGLKEKDIILYDRHAGHKIEHEDKIYHVIKFQDVVGVL